MTYPALETLKLERVGAVGWLINNRPEQLNAMNAKMRDEFLEQAQQSMGRFIEDDSACFPGQGLQPLTPPTAFHW